MTPDDLQSRIRKSASLLDAAEQLGRVASVLDPATFRSLEVTAYVALDAVTHVHQEERLLPELPGAERVRSGFLALVLDEKALLEREAEALVSPPSDGVPG